MGQAKSKLRKVLKASKEKNHDSTAIAGDEHAFICGVVEGFYGKPWTMEQRKELFKRMRDMGLNTYLYAPKDDYKHRMCWREKYSDDEAETLKTLIEEASQQGVTFIYAISPGLDIIFSSEEERDTLKEKLFQVKGLGCDSFAILFDDIQAVLCASDVKEFKSAANAQASIANVMFEALNKPRLLFCPTEYCNRMAIPNVNASPYLKTLGKVLHPQISIMWTGTKVVSNTITVESIKVLNEILGRKVMIWDNIHANDYDSKRVFLGPYKGRSTQLIPHLTGVLTNPNCEFESNFVAMHTIASWWKSYKATTLGTSEVENTYQTTTLEKVDDRNKPEDNPLNLLPSPVDSTVTNNPEPVTSSNRGSLSSGSGRKSNSDCDLSGHSSSKNQCFMSLPAFEHGDYDPNSALEKAVQDWLELFSQTHSYNIIPESGTRFDAPVTSASSSTTHTNSPMSNHCSTTNVADAIMTMVDKTKTPSASSSSVVNNVVNDIDHAQPSIQDDVTKGEGVKSNCVPAEPPEQTLSAALEHNTTCESTEKIPLRVQTEVVTEEVYDECSTPINTKELAASNQANLNRYQNKLKTSHTVDAKADRKSVNVMCGTHEKDNLSLYETNPVRIEDLRLLVECFHLPYEHGNVGKNLILRFIWLKENASKLSRSSERSSKDYVDKALQWSNQASVFDESCHDLQQAFKRLFTSPNKALLSDLRSYMRDVEELVTVLRSYVKWLGLVEVKTDASLPGDENSEYFTISEDFGWLESNTEVWTFRGGLLGDFQRLLPVSSSFDCLHQSLSMEPHLSYVIRPFLAHDKQAVFDICCTSHNETVSEFCLPTKDLPADTLLGALLRFSSDYCFVVEDGEGLCGYAVAALDAKKFWKKYKSDYLPEIKRKNQDLAEDIETKTEAKSMITELFYPKDWLNNETNDLCITHPSLMTLALHARGNHAMARSMTVSVLSALKSHGSCGVQVLLPHNSFSFLQLYSKMGFVTVYAEEDSVCDKTKILGRTF